MTPQTSGPAFAVHIDERELAEDLSHVSEAGRVAIEPMVRRFKANGVPVDWLKRCDPEARDGTRLPGCVKIYISHPAGQWGAVFLGGAVGGSLKLFLLAIGERHPRAPWQQSVYETAHRRLHKI